MAIEGALTDVSLADICQLLSMGRKTGCLSMADQENSGQIFFDEGRVVYSSLANRTDKLGELLLKNGAISEEALSEAMGQQSEEEGTLLGQLLVTAGAISQEELEKYISVQIQEAVYHLFTWNTGTFHFTADIKPEEGWFLIDTSADALLMEGARRVDEWSVMEKKISSLDLIFALERNPLEEEGVELSDHQRRLIPLMNGERTVTQLVDDSGLVEFDTGKALYGLIQGGFAAQVGKRSEAADGGSAGEHCDRGLALYRSGELEDAVREFKLALEIDSTEPDARKYLGLISLRKGRPREAIVHFDEMASTAEATYPLLRNRAFAYERLNRFQDALDTLDSAEQVNSNDPDVVLARAIVLLKSGEGLDALKAFQSYRGRLGSDAPSSVFYAYSVLAAGMAGDLDRAIEIGREGLGHYPNEGSILVNTGGAIAHRGEPEAAQSFFQRAIDEGGNPPQAHKAMGDQALKGDDKATARACYEAAIKLNPRLGEDVYIKLGAIALDAKNESEAGQHWRRALEINPENHELQARLEQLGASSGA